MSNDTHMVEGSRVWVKLAGDDTKYLGTVLDRPRKMWVEIDNNLEYPEFIREMIADENNIVEWEIYE